MDNQKQILFILGMHRSGTSAVAGCFHNLGFFLGDDLMDKSEDNAYGYFEENKIVQWNNEILNAAGFSWDDPDAFVKVNDFTESAVVQSIKAYLVRSTNENKFVAFKDPRFCITLPIWLFCCKQVMIEPKFVIVIRNPEDIAQSLHRRDLISFKKSYQLFLNHIFKAEKNTRPFPRVTFDFKDFLEEPISILKNSLKVLNINPSLLRQKKVLAKINSFIDAKVVHHHSTDNDIQYSIVKLAYQNFQFIHETSTIDQLRKEFYSGNSIFQLEDETEIVFTAQLFYDTGKGFNEAQSIIQRVNLDQEELIFDLPKFDQKTTIKTFRFDPATIPIQIQLEEIVARLDNKELQHLETSHHNGLFLPSGQHVFLTFDSQLYLNGSDHPIEKLIIKLRYKQIEKEGIGELSSFLETYEVIPKKDFIFLHEKINEHQTRLKDKKEEFDLALSQLEKDNFAQINVLSRELGEIRSALEIQLSLRDTFKQSLDDEQKVNAERKEQIKEYREQLEKYKRTKNVLEEQLNTANDNIVQLKNEQLSKQFALQTLEDKLSLKLSDSEHLSNQLLALKQDKETLNQQLKQANDTINQLKKEQQSNQLHLNKLENELASNRSDSKQLSNDFLSLTQDKEALSQQLEEANDTISQLKKEQQSSQLHLNKLENKLVLNQATIKQTNSQLLKIKKVNTSLEKEIQALSKKLKEKNKDFVKAEKLANQYEIKNQQLNYSLNNYQTSLDKKEEELIQVNSSQQEKEKIILEQQQHIISFETSNAELIQSIDTKQQYIHDIQKKTLEMEQAHLHSKHEIATLNTIKEQQKHEITNLNNQKEQLTKSIKVHKEEQQNIYATLKSQQQEIHLLNIQHQENVQIVNLQKEELLNKNTALYDISSSMSYKIGRFLTAPFRFVYNYIPRGTKFGTKLALFFGFFLVVIKKPFSILKHINQKNFNTLIKALRTEDPSTILKNFKALLNGTPTNLIRSSSSQTLVITSYEDYKSNYSNTLENTKDKDIEVIKVVAKQTDNMVESNPESIVLEHVKAEKILPIKEKEISAVSTTPASILLHIEYAGFNKREQIRISGWAIALEGVQDVEIWDKSTKLGNALIGVSRTDVKEAFPAYNFGKGAGYVFEISLDKLTEVTVRVIDNVGTIIEQKTAIQQLPEALRNLHVCDTYDVWIENNTLSDGMRQQLKKEQAQFDYRPRISIVMPVYNVAEIWLKKAIDSIKNQLYDNWEICLADDASPKPHVVPFLQKMEASDDRIKVFYRKENGNISAATNSALSIASGDFIAFMDNDDELAEHAFYEIVATLNKDKTIDILYSDEDKVTEEGHRYNPFFKPDWSPELLLSYNYFNHLLCVRRTIVDKVKGFRTNFDGAQDYDFILRIIEQSKKVHHIPKVLYHWRALDGSIAAQGDAKSDNFNFFDKCTGALQAHFDRNNIPAKAFHPKFAQLQGLGLNHIKWSNSGPLVSIIIPSRNHYDTLKTCISSLQKTTYKRYEIIIADNASTDKRTLKYLQKIKRKPKIKVLTIPNKGERFSYSYVNNQAAKKAKGDYILLLNDDIEVITPNWLSQMMGYIQLDGVGIVGAKLLYPDNTIQHAGVINGLYPHGYDNLPDHAYKNFPADTSGYFFTAAVSCNYAAVTAACLVMPKRLYEEVNGLDEEQFGLAYNDVDLCLRVVEKGYRVVYAAQAQLYHYESKSRKNTLHIEEVALFKRKWKHFIDPYYNKNLSKRRLFAINPLSSLDYQAKQTKLLVATHNLNFEGAPLQMLEIVEGLLTKEGDYHIDIYSPVDGPLKQAYLDLGLNVHIFEDPVTAALHQRQTYDEGIKKFSLWMIEKGYHKAYANTLVTFFVNEACQKIGIKSLWGIHESSDPQDFFTYLPTALQAKAYESFNAAYALVFVAKATERIFQDFNVRQSSVVINNGLRPERFKHVEEKTSLQVAYKAKLGVDKEEVLFLNLGTVCARKGQLDFVKAAIECIQQGMTNAKFLLVGARDEGITGEYLAQINTVIETSNTADYFIIVGETKEVEQYYIAADIFVCSSYNESYPRVILEAMLFQLPIITTPIFGIVEQVIEHINGLFYVPGDITQLTKHTMELSVDFDKRQLFTKNAPYVYELINTYEEMIEKYHKLLI